MAENLPGFIALREEMDARIIGWSNAIDEGWLADDFEWVSASGNHSRRPAWLTVTHLFNHATHHRGQITTLLSRRGVDIGVTDLPMIELEIEL